MARDIYKVVIEGSESIHINGTFSMQFKGDDGEVETTLTVSTKMIDEGHKDKVPRILVFNCEVKANELREAYEIALAVTSEVHRTLSIAVNSYGGELTPRTVYDATPDKKRRRFWQGWREVPLSNIPRTHQFIHVQQIGPIFKAIENLPLELRYNVEMAIEQYVGALSHWTLGTNVLVVARLFMAAEALTIAYIKLSMMLCGLTREELAKRIGLPNGEYPEPWIRREVVFRGNKEVHRSAKKVSDGFEHGFLKSKELMKHAFQIAEVVAELVRTSILDIMDLPTKCFDQLTSDPFNIPKPYLGWVGSFDGYILGESNQLAPIGHEHPCIEFGFSPVNFEKTDKEILIGVNLDPVKEHIGEGLKFKRRNISCSDDRGFIMLNEENENTEKD